MPVTELHHWAQHDDAAAMRATLKEGGCELEAREDKQGTTAFLVACMEGSVECMQLLAHVGCGTAATNNKGQTALMITAQSAVPAALQLATEKGWSELEARSGDGSTAFLHACVKGSVECMEILVDAGCDTAAKNVNGDSGMAIARRKGHDAVVTRLQELLDEHEAASLKHEARELTGDERFAEAMDALKKALRLAPGCAETQAALDAAEAGAAGAVAKKELRAEKAEAELMAMLDAEEAGKQAKRAAKVQLEPTGKPALQAPEPEIEPLAEAGAAGESEAQPEPHSYKQDGDSPAQATRVRGATSFYDVLDVPTDADAGQLKAARKKLSLLLHPDKTQAAHAEEAFKVRCTTHRLFSR